MKTMVELPAEILYSISHYLDPEALRHLRLVCSALADIFRGAVYRRVHLDIRKDNRQRAIEKLSILADDEKHVATSSADELDIGSLSPYFDPQYYTSSGKSLNWRSLIQLGTISQKSALEKVEKKLYQAVCALKRLHSVRWITHSEDTDIAQLSVVQALPRLLNLTTLHLSITHAKLCIPLDQLNALETISISTQTFYRPNQFSDQIFDSLAKLISTTSSLDSIYVMRGFRLREQVEVQHSLHNLLQHRSPDNPMNLKHLGIEQSLIKLDNITIPHIRNLTSLTMLKVVELDAIRYSFAGHQLHTSEALIQSQKHVGSNLSDIWASFYQMGIQLQTINIDKPVSSVFQYLNAYRGLRKLHISSGYFRSVEASRNTALQFYGSAVFSNHSDTLEELNINAWYDDLWCFCSPAATAIQRAYQLRVLELCIPRSQAESTMNKLFYILFRLPNIEEVHLSSSGSYSDRDEMLQSQDTRLAKGIMLEVINRKLGADEQQTKSIPRILVSTPSGQVGFRPRPLSTILQRDDGLIYVQEQ